ncbi:hypothetical protein [Natrinema pallidum]|uniref:Nucleolar protein-like protein n=1 Tax=Natrinema pallidum DSM 3751 TaxID=1227495 RepID=L9YIC8_9EURY|nr:hypothetical protein [Natrinema pallidum]ELY73869.1 nucleolar protein-like protein [Natrinema pallidum DSM 3751]
MSETNGWFAAGDRDDPDAMTTAIRQGSADESRDWPALAVEAGFASEAEEYYDALREATTAATRAAVTERERADDRQLVHAIRAMDDMGRILL